MQRISSSLLAKDQVQPIFRKILPQILLSPVSSSGLPLWFSGQLSGLQDCIQSLWGPWRLKTPWRGVIDSMKDSPFIYVTKCSNTVRWVHTYLLNLSCRFGRETQTVLYWQFSRILRKENHGYTHIMLILTNVWEKAAPLYQHNTPERLCWNLERAQSLQWEGARGDLWLTASESWLTAVECQRRLKSHINW